jgi:hypothetical protein
MSSGARNLLLLTESGRTQYARKLIDTYGASEVWSLNDRTGTTVTATATADRNGTYTNVTLDAADSPGTTGQRAPLWDSTDTATVYTSSLTSLFDKSEGSIFIWCKVSGSGVWTDATVRRIFHLTYGTTATLGIRKTNTNDQVAVHYYTGAAYWINAGYVIPSPPTDWFSMALTWSITNSACRGLYNGVAQMTNATAPSLAQSGLTAARIGSSQVPNEYWSGYLYCAAVKFGARWSDADILAMHNAASS